MSSQTLLIIITALIPVLILIIHVYRKDNIKPEPVGQIIKAFMLGILTVPLSFTVSIPLMLVGAYTDFVVTISDAIKISFYGAAIPEELAKLFVLWLVLRKNKYFDEKMDGIVYAVCVSMGFAAFENITYLFNSADTFLQVGTMRAFTAIPGHFCFGIAMGYYYSLAKFEKKNKVKNIIMTFVAPIAIHGIYDSILFSMGTLEFYDINSLLADIIVLAFTALFIFFCFKMWKWASVRIHEHIERDKSDIFKRNKFE